MDSPFTPPEELFQDETTVRLEVRLHVDPNGRLWTTHAFLTPEDEMKSKQWPGGGLRHVAHGLLQEAVRREAFLCALMQLTNQPDFLATFGTSGAEYKATLVGLLSGKVDQNMRDLIPKLSPGSVREVLEMLLMQA